MSSKVPYWLVIRKEKVVGIHLIVNEREKKEKKKNEAKSLLQCRCRHRHLLGIIIFYDINLIIAYYRTTDYKPFSFSLEVMTSLRVILVSFDMTEEKGVNCPFNAVKFSRQLKREY